MAYLALRFDAGAADADGWADALLDAGALSVDVSDPRADTPDEAPLYGEPGERAGEFWPLNCLSALFPADADADAAFAAAGDALKRQLPPFERHLIADQDWVRSTQDQFAPIRIGERLWIVPSWCCPVDPQAINISLDPGLAFGTGSHPTTRLCLAWLATELRRGADVLDYGCGSGILAIAAAKLGAGQVVGTDVDPQAVAASRENAERNHAAATFVLADELPACPVADFDVVVANILANPLLLLAPALAARVRPAGQIVLSGVLSSQLASVTTVYARWFNIESWRTEDGWVALSGVRRRDAP